MFALSELRSSEFANMPRPDDERFARQFSKGARQVGQVGQVGNPIAADRSSAILQTRLSCALFFTSRKRW